MPDSRQYRKKHYRNGVISLVLLVVVLSLLSRTADETSGLKMDFSEGGLYTISDATEEIVGRLQDKVMITYYCSEELEVFLPNLVRDTKDQFEELRQISDGNLRFEIVNPEVLFDSKAAAATDVYMADYDAEEYELLKDQEPTPPMDIQAMMAGRKSESPEEIRKRREAMANKMAGEDPKKTVRQAYKELLLADFKRREERALAEVGIRALQVSDRRANSVRTQLLYSAIKIAYLDRAEEVIPRHLSLESLEGDLAERILKVTQDRKPVVAFFDGRKPPAPPMNPARPTPPPPSDYSMVIGALQELLDVRELSLKEGDSIDDLAMSIKGDEERKLKEEMGEEPAGAGEVALANGDQAKYIKCLVVAQPHALEDRQVYEINRAVSMGVPTIFLVSPYTVDVSQQTGVPGGLPITILNSGLEDLFKAWGVSLRDEMLASNNAGPIMYPQTDMFGRRGPLPTPVSFVVSSGREYMNDESRLTKRFPGLAFPSTSGLKFTETAGLVSTELANSGEESWSVKIDPLAGMNNPFNRGRPSGPTILGGYAEKLASRKDPSDTKDFVKPVTLATLVEGEFTFRFEGESVPEWKKAPAGGAGDPHQGIPGLPPGLQQGVPPGVPPVRDGNLLPDPSDPISGEAPQDEAQAPVKAAPAAAAQENPEAAQKAPATPVEAAKPAEKKAPAPKAHVDVQKGRAIFLSSVDMLKNDFVRDTRQMQIYWLNFEFFRTCIEIFALDASLNEIKDKTMTVRTWKDGAVEKEEWIKILNLAGIPLLVGLYGLVRYLRRKKHSVAYERDFLQGR